MSVYRERETSYYELLEVHPEAGPTEIYEAYQRARETYSPHSPAIYTMFTEEEAKELLKLIDEAYSTLSNRSRKKAYDLKIGLIQEDHIEPSHPAASRPSHPIHSPNLISDVVEERKVGRAEDGWSGVVRIHKKSDALPDGSAKTRFGIYTQNLDFEKDIDSVEECDGSFLQKIREYRCVAIEDLSEAMKVSKSSLKALEENDLDRLPVQVFTRGMVVQYCRMLNLDEKKLVDAYMTYFKAHKNEPS